MTADAIACGLQARRSGSSWMAKCPAHEDRNPSLFNPKAKLSCTAMLDANSAT